VLARIQDFLPRLKEENESLAQRIRDNPSSADIENIEEDAEQYIEMASPNLDQLKTPNTHDPFIESRTRRVGDAATGFRLSFRR
jgi:hypothetical protein